MKYDYPELLRRGTAVGPVTKEMRKRCKEKCKGDIEFWTDFIPIVREEMDKEGYEGMYWGEKE